MSYFLKIRRDNDDDAAMTPNNPFLSFLPKNLRRKWQSSGRLLDSSLIFKSIILWSNILSRKNDNDA